MKPLLKLACRIMAGARRTKRTRRDARPGPVGWPGRVAALILCLAASTSPAAPTNTHLFPEFAPQKGREYLQNISPLVENQIGTNAGARFIVARFQSQLGEKAEAERLARLALETDPGRADIQIFLADILIRQDRLEEASGALRRASEADPGNAGAQRRLGMVLDRLGDSQGAKAALQAAVRSNPEDSLARMLLGRLLLNQDQAAAARTELERACQIDPQSINARYALYQAQTKLGDQAAAEKTLAAFRELKKREKSAMDVEDIRYDDERDLRRFTAGFHTAVASQLLPRGAEDAAEAHLLQAVRVDPAETQAREMLASLYLRQRRLADARPVLAQLVALQPRDTAARLNFATVLLQLRDPAAVPELQRVLELDPRNPPALHNLARFYLATRQQLPEALSLCQRLIAIQPAAVNFDLLGWACYANHRTNDALAASAQAVEKDPSNPDYRQRYERLKQAAGANR